MGVDKIDLKIKRNNAFAFGVLIMSAFVWITDDSPTTDEVNAGGPCIDQKLEEN